MDHGQMRLTMVVIVVMTVIVHGRRSISAPTGSSWPVAEAGHPPWWPAPRSGRPARCRSGHPGNPGGRERPQPSGDAPAASSAPSSMSPLMPATGSRMAKRPSGIDLQYACEGGKRTGESAGLLDDALPLGLAISDVENPFRQAGGEAGHRGQLGDRGRPDPGQTPKPLQQAVAAWWARRPGCSAARR